MNSEELKEYGFTKEDILRAKTYSCPYQIGTFGCACRNCHKQMTWYANKIFNKDTTKAIPPKETK